MTVAEKADDECHCAPAPPDLDQLLPDGSRRYITARYDHSGTLALNISAKEDDGGPP